MYPNAPTASHPIGTLVQVRRPDDFKTDIRSKIERGRVGRIARKSEMLKDMVSVEFPAEGRRKAFSHRFALRDLVLVEPSPQEDK